MGVVSEQFSDLQFDFLWDTESATISYFGEAQPGTPTSAAAWRLRRLDTTSGIVLRYAEGDSHFKHIWDNRASLTY